MDASNSSRLCAPQSITNNNKGVCLFSGTAWRTHLLTTYIPLYLFHSFFLPFFSLFALCPWCGEGVSGWQCGSSEWVSVCGRQWSRHVASFHPWESLYLDWSTSLWFSSRGMVWRCGGRGWMGSYVAYSVCSCGRCCCCFFISLMCPHCFSSSVFHMFYLCCLVFTFFVVSSVFSTDLKIKFLVLDSICVVNSLTWSKEEYLLLLTGCYERK